MRNILLLLLLFGLFCSLPHSGAEEKPVENLKRGVDLEKNAKAVLESDMTGRELYEELRKASVFDGAEEGWQEDSVELASGDSIGFVYYIPDGYDPKVPCGVLVILHGGVSRPQPIPLEGLKGYGENFRSLVDNADSPAIAVLLQGSAKNVWWSDAGRESILGAIRKLKFDYNIDSNRVVVTGFSDGGSGCYFLSMADPSAFSQLWSLNGMALVGTYSGKNRLYIENTRSRFMYSCNTKADQLYPPEAYQPVWKAMEEVGTDCETREFEGGHSPSYLSQIWDETSKLWDTKKRNPWRSELSWAVSDARFNRVDWLTVNALGEIEDSAEFANKPISIRGRMTIGVGIDQTYQGAGVKVKEISRQGNAESAGVKTGDIIIELNGFKIETVNDLYEAINTMVEGEEFIVKVIRDEEEMELKATVAERKPVSFMQYNSKAGYIEAKVANNIIEIKDCYVQEFSISLSPELVDFEKEVVVKVNGKEVFRGMPTYDKQYILDCWLRDADRMSLPACNVTPMLGAQP